MSNEKEKIKFVPELRFPEFEGEWKEKELIAITDKKVKWSFTGGPFGSSLKSSDYVSEENGIRIIQLQNIGDGEFKNDYKIYTSEGKADELLSNNIFPGEIIMSKMGDPVGRACLIPDFHDRYVMASDGIRVVVDESKYDKYFIYSLINSKPFRAKIENSSTGSTRKRIGLSVLKKLTFNVPKSKTEQQKIAATLTSLDQLIAAENEKLEALQDHKKGLLQQLFPAKGSSVPKLRFGEFSGEWEEKKLGDEDVSVILRGGSPRPIKEYLTSSIDGLNWLKIGDVDKSSKYVTQTKEKVIHSALSKTREVKPGDLIMSNSMSFGRPYILKIKTCIHDGWIAITEIDDNIHTDFLYYLILSWRSQKYFLDAAAGGGIKNLNAERIKDLPVIFPVEIEEQQKIADCLSSADILIDVQSERIESLKEHKKGLIQQMFPNLNRQTE